MLTNQALELWPASQSDHRPITTDDIGASPSTREPSPGPAGRTLAYLHKPQHIQYTYDEGIRDAPTPFLMDMTAPRIRFRDRSH